MARQTGKKAARAPKPRKRIGWRIGAAALALLALGTGAMYMNARTVHVRYAEVWLEDLPAGFDGTKVLFASDFDLCGLNTAEDAAALFDRLQALGPDLLLLGGDYASPSLVDRLNGGAGSGEALARGEFFKALAGFQAPLGKLAVSGDNDGEPDALKLAMMGSGVTLIDGGAQVLHRGGDAIAVAGIGEGTSDVAGMAAKFRSEQFVIALTHRPSRVVDVRIAEAGNGGQWADLTLAGHTHGGQIQIAGRTILSLDETEKRYLSGWHADGAPVLVTEGVGCEGVNLRLGSQAEVWLITLRCE